MHGQMDSMLSCTHPSGSAAASKPGKRAGRCLPAAWAQEVHIEDIETPGTEDSGGSSARKGFALFV